jgi:hypothetical protein
MPATPLPSQTSVWALPTDFPIVTIPYVPGYRVTKVIGLTYGLIVRSRGLGRNIVAGFRSLGGGEITPNTRNCSNRLATRRSPVSRTTRGGSAPTPCCPSGSTPPR